MGTVTTNPPPGGLSCLMGVNHCKGPAHRKPNRNNHFSINWPDSPRSIHTLPLRGSLTFPGPAFLEPCWHGNRLKSRGRGACARHCMQGSAHRQSGQDQLWLLPPPSPSLPVSLPLTRFFQGLFVVVLAPPPPRLKDFPLGLHFVLSPWVLCSSRETRWQEEPIWGLVAPAVHLCSALRCLFGRWLVSRVCPRHHYENLFNGMSFERRKETVGEER